MSNSYHQLFIHLIFIVKYRRHLIKPQVETELHSYLTGIIRNKGHRLLAIGGMPDHLHLFFGMHPNEALSGLVKVLKTESSKWMKERFGETYKFQWQPGYAAFSHNKKQVPTVVQYVLNQKQHHQKRSFREEIVGMLNEYEVDFDEKYLFKDPE